MYRIGEADISQSLKTIFKTLNKEGCALRARGVKERVLAFGKLQLLLVGSRLHFPSENRKSCTSLHSGSIDSVQNREDICLRQIRFTISKRSSVLRSADGDLRLCLKNPRTFEKVRSKLSSFLIKIENFRALRENLPSFCAADHHSAKPTIIPPMADYHSREA